MARVNEPTLHPELDPESRRRLLVSGVELFNQGEFFAAHEAFEEVWRSQTPEPRDLWQGLIQVAAAMHHVVVLGHRNGPRSLLRKARLRLRAHLPNAYGLDVAGLLGDLEPWERWLEEAAERRPGMPVMRVLDRQALR